MTTFDGTLSDLLDSPPCPECGAEVGSEQYETVCSKGDYCEAHGDLCECETCINEKEREA